MLQNLSSAAVVIGTLRVKKEGVTCFRINSLPLITFSNILDQDQAPQYVGPDLDPNCLTL